MRASVIIAAHNEGQSLWKTVRSCIESIGKLDHEILIADDASDEESVEEALRRFPHLNVHRHDERQGASPAKHSGASNARGEVLVFLDGHCNPERDAIKRLVEDVERLEGQSIVTPTILALDTVRWKNKEWQVGHGYRLELDTFDCGWLPLTSLRKVRLAGRQFYESPAAIGCAFAVHRELYDDLRGFDPDMRIWGVEDLDFSLKCWLMGHSIVHDPEARIGHRFRDKFDNYDVPGERILVNKLRMAFKNFTQAVWSEWVERCRQEHSGRLHEHPEGLWACAWKLFDVDHASAEQERAYLLARRQRDEFWYAQHFGLTWPRLESAALTIRGAETPEPKALASIVNSGPSPSPSPCPEIQVEIDDPTTLLPDFRTVEFAIFRTMSPLVRITLPPTVNPVPGEFQVLVDDGEDASDDHLDISSLFSFSGGIAIAQVPETVPINSFPGPNQSTYRALLDDPNRIRIIYFGENRLQFKLNEETCFVGHFLHYDDDNEIVVGIDDGTESAPQDPDIEIMTNHIMIHFETSWTDANISQFLFAEQLRPQGLARQFGAFQVRDLQSLSDTALLNRVTELAAALGRGTDAVHFDYLTDDPTISGQRYARAFREDYVAATGVWSDNGRKGHHQHFVMQTFAAHRLIDLTRDQQATVRVFMAGSGVGDGNNFSGPDANKPNQFFVRGNRLFQATAVHERELNLPFVNLGRVAVTDPSDAGNPNVGDISNVADDARRPLGHDTGVMAQLGGDGEGNQLAGADRDIAQIVQGTGKDAEFRVVRFPLSQMAYYKQLSLSATDLNTRIHVVERSFSTVAPPNVFVRAILTGYYATIANGGKLIVAASWNQGADVANCDAGLIGPNHNTPRADLVGLNEFKKNALVVGQGTQVLTPGIRESRLATNVGEEISVVAPGRFCNWVRRDGTTVYFGTTGVPNIGSSGTTPLVAGIAAELMLVDPTLQQGANIVKVAEMIEATADDIGPLGKDNDVGHGRVNFWKAVLAAANGGLSAEGRTATASGNDNFFKNLPLKDEASTTWYGFEIRQKTKNAAFWLKTGAGAYVQVQDANQARPTIPGVSDADIVAHVSSQANRDANGRILPSLPFTQAELFNEGVTQWYLARFSVKRDQLLDKTKLIAVPPGKNPANDPGDIIFELPIDDREDLRRAQDAQGPNAIAIKALVDEFDDFVFHISNL